MKATITLTNQQLEQLQQVYEEADAAAVMGKPGLILAHVIGERALVFFMDNRRGKEFQKVMGVPIEKIGKTGGKK